MLVVDPAGIVAEGVRGHNDLYVALTRATQRLGVVHAGDLPPAVRPHDPLNPPHAVSAACADPARAPPSIVDATKGEIHDLRDRGRGPHQALRRDPGPAGVDLAAREGTVSACWGPTGPARRPPSGCSPPCSSRTPAARASPGSTCSRSPRRCGHASGLTGEYASVDEDLTGAEPAADRTAAACAPARRGRAPRQLLDWFDARRRPGRHLQRRHAPPPRPGRQPGRPALGDLPRRAGPDPAKREGMWGVVRRVVARPPCCSPPSTWRRPTPSPTRSP